MSRNGTLILEAALALSSKDRARIAEQLITSLDGPVPSALEQKEIDRAWAEEIERRVGETDRPGAKLIPYSKVMEDVRSLLRNRKRGGGVKARQRGKS